MMPLIIFTTCCRLFESPGVDSSATHLYCLTKRGFVRARNKGAEGARLPTSGAESVHSFQTSGRAFSNHGHIVNFDTSP